MGTTTKIEINHIRSPSPSPSPSGGSHDDELNENGVQVSPAEISDQYSVIHAQSHSGSSSHPGEFVHLSYPSELHEAGEVHPSDSASRLDPQERSSDPATNSAAVRRTSSRRRTAPREQSRPIPEENRDTRTESVYSTEEFLSRPSYRGGGMPRPQSYYGQEYTHSSSSGSYSYPQIPPSNQLVQSQQPPMPHPYPHQYPQMPGQPPPMAYPSPMGYPQPYSHPPPPYTSSPWGAPTFSQYGAPTGYFPQQYPQQYPPQQYQSPYMPQYPPQQQIMGMPPPPPVDAYRVQSPTATNATTIGAASNSEAERAKAEQEDIIARFEKLMKAQKESEIDKEAALKQAADQAKAAAAQAAERAEAEKRIREEARQEALRAYEEKARAAAEQAAREQQIRKEAAEAALKAAADEAAAKAERAALEKKIAEDAAAAATTAAEKQAADAAKAAQDEAKKQQEEAEKKLKEAEDAAKKAKADAEELEKKVKDATPTERKKPVRFKDAIGRNYNFPWERCHRWRDMEGLINQAFSHIENLAEHVHNGHYDLLGPDKEIIMPQYWESTIEPDMHVTMMLWPLPEPKPDEPPIPPLDGGIVTVGDLLHPPGLNPRKKKKGSSRPGALGMWMMGGAPRKPAKKT